VTIEKGADWGSEIERPAELVVVADDAALARELARTDRPDVAVATGDLFATVGARPIGERTTVLRLPIDLMIVRLDGGDPIVAVAHVIVRSRRSLGGWWRGGVLAIMNAEFVGPYDVAPRGHPNDGRVETFELSETVGIRQRLAIRRRMRSGTHLPHPAISHRSVRRAAWTFASPRTVIIDGVVSGRARSLEVDVHADAAHVHA
jgi:hypothetical protein